MNANFARDGRLRTLLPATLLLCVLVGAPPCAGAATIGPELLRATSAGGRAEALVVLRERADLSPARALPDKVARGRFVVERLGAVAARSQTDLVRALAADGVEHRAYWIVNMVWVRAGRETLGRIAARPEVDHVVANPRVRVPLPDPYPLAARVPAAPEPNIDSTGAPDVFWAAGFRGQGVVVAAGDTGQEWSHPALRRAYRGFDGDAVTHDHHWWDAIHSGGGSCGADSPEPCDDDDHGTATMGVIVGDDGAGNQIGMAPAARWIGCRNMDQGVGSPATYAECFQFFLAPTDLAGEDPRPELAPHVVNNSWICPESEGCTDPEVLVEAVDALTAAGIVVVASAGNDGPSCASVYAPPAIYDAAWTVGSANVFGEVSQFSARGPVEADGSGRIKPDFISVGEAVRSSIRDGGYAGFDGTSMSGPHVVGLTALTISAQPCLAGRLEAMERHLRDGAFAFDTTEKCGGVPGDVIPNNTYGWGIVHAELPRPELCAGALGGTVSGVEGQGAACRNEASGESVSIPLAGGTSWDCAAAGLAFAPGDPVALGARGAATGDAPVGGSLVGATGATALCRNEESGESVTVALDGAGSWDCEAAGLTVAPGDRVTQAVRGQVPPG